MHYLYHEDKEEENKLTWDLEQTKKMPQFHILCAGNCGPFEHG